MKTTLIILTTALFQMLATAQTETIECLGETIVVVNGDDTRTSSNGQNATVFIINMQDSTLTARSSTQANGLSQDVFLIKKKSFVGGKEIYDLANPSQLNQSTYGLSIDQNNVELVMFVNERTITVTSIIKKRYKQEKTKPTSAWFLGRQDSFDIGIKWDKNNPNQIRIIDPHANLLMEVKYYEYTTRGITIYTNHAYADTIEILLSGHSTFGQFSENGGFTIQEVIDVLASILPNKEDYDGKIIRQKQLEEGLKLRTYGFMTLTIRKTDSGNNSTDKSKLVNQVYVSCTVVGNEFTRDEKKTIFIQLVSPDGKILYSEKGNTFTLRDNKITSYTDSKTIHYLGESVDIGFFIDVNKGTLVSGGYRVLLYCEGYLIGADSFTLR